MFETIRKMYRLDLPKDCPPCRANDPKWLHDLRDQYVATGFVELGAIRNGLAVGETLIGPRCAYSRTADGLTLKTLTVDETRGWRIEAAQDTSHV